MNNDRESEMNKQSYNTSDKEKPFADNPTPTKPDHPNARARVYVDGLSVYSFNQSKKRAEFAFLREHHTTVQVKIYKKDDCKVFWSSDSIGQSTDNATITINTTKSTKPGAEGKRYQKLPKDDEDFTHLPNIAEWYGVPSLNYLPDADVKAALTARLNVHDAVFYTLQKSRSLAMRSKGSGSAVPIGQIGRVIGGDIFCLPNEDLIIEIKLQDGTVVPVPPLKNPDKYEITVRTKTAHRGNHFSLIYKILEKPAGEEEFSLQFADPEEPSFIHCGDSGVILPHDHHEEERKELDILATEFPCQSFGGGGVPPDIP